jgi:hypothetical protein
MTKPLEVEVLYTGGVKLHLKNCSFKDVAKFIAEKPGLKDYDPLQLKFSTGKILYYDKAAFLQYLEGNLEQPELVELTECDGLYRNKTQLVLEDKTEVDAGALWKRQHDYLIMVDDDQYIGSGFDPNAFEKID